MSLLGVDIGNLTYDDCPEIVPGRTLHIDGDFVAYYCSHDEEEPWESIKESARHQVETLQKKASAEHVCVHLTAGDSDKGGRYGIALQKPYQSNRRASAKPSRLESTRLFLRDVFPSQYWRTQEADDGLSQANWEAIQRGSRELSVIVSQDKDLLMCQGLRMDWNTHRLQDVCGYGQLRLSNGKLTGHGEAMFWAQMLMGDSADTIQGLPKVAPHLADLYKPLQERNGEPVFRDKPINCGPKMAYAILSGVDNSHDAYKIVSGLYKGYDGNYKNYRTGENVPWDKIFMSEAVLLWMRRTENTFDVMNFLSEVSYDGENILKNLDIKEDS